MTKIITIETKMYQVTPLTGEKPLNYSEAHRLKELYKEKFNLKTKIERNKNRYDVFLYKRIYN